MSTVGPIGHIKHSLDLVGLTDDTEEPTSAMQYAVANPAGRAIYGDQEWVRSGQALAELPDGAKVQRRTITISYGEWEEANPRPPSASRRRADLGGRLRHQDRRR